MTVADNVEYPELIRPIPYQAFQISLNIHLSDKYNFSYLLYEPCVTYVIISLKYGRLYLDYNFLINRWLQNPIKGSRSGWSIFNIEIPTGYRIEERFLKDLVGFGIVRNLRDAENYPNMLNFLFEFVNLSTFFSHFRTAFIIFI